MTKRGESRSVDRASMEHSRRRGRHGGHVARAAAACRLPFDRTYSTFTGTCASLAASSVSSPAGQFLRGAVLPTLTWSCARRRQLRTTVPQSSAGPRTLRPRRAPGPHSGMSRIPNPAVCAPRQASSTTCFRTIGTASRPTFLLARKCSISGAGPESWGARSSVLNHPCMWSGSMQPGFEQLHHVRMSKSFARLRSKPCPSSTNVAARRSASSATSTAIQMRRRWSLRGC